jgi:outer membrane protein
MRVGATAVALLGFSMPGAHAESLRAALTAAYAHNPSITSALYAVKVAAENIALRKSAILPTIGASTTISNTVASGLTGGSISNTQKAQLGLSYSQTIFDNHKTDANVEQARALVEVANQQLRTTESTVLLDVVEAYMNVILNTQLVTLRTDTVTFYQSQVKAAQDRQNIGEGTKIDVAQAQASLASGIASQKAAVAALQAAQASYKHWVGHAPANLSSDFNYGTLIPATVERAMRIADSLNPSILAAKASIRAAQAGLDAANAEFGPSAALSGSVGPSFSSAPAGSGGGAGFGGTVSLSVSLPVYAGGALGAGSRQASLSAVKSGLDAQAAKDAVDEQVVSAWTSLQNAAAQIAAAKSGVDANNLALQGVIQERDVGQKTTLDVLNQEATLQTAQEALITANANRVIAAFTLIAATGKMSPHDLGLRTATKSAQGYTSRVEDTWEEVRSLK